MAHGSWAARAAIAGRFLESGAIWTCGNCGNLPGSAAFPNLLTSPKTADKAAFSQIVLEGKSAMPAFKGNKIVAEGIDSLYDYVSSKRPK